jgi:NADH:quinone reductase (non-electrogenic)
MKTPITELLGIKYPIVQGGIAIGLIDDIPTCATLIGRIVAECRENLARATAYTA